jgi:hypothetical protein
MTVSVGLAPLHPGYDWSDCHSATLSSGRGPLRVVSRRQWRRHPPPAALSLRGGHCFQAAASPPCGEGGAFGHYAVRPIAIRALASQRPGDPKAGEAAPQRSFDVAAIGRTEVCRPIAPGAAALDTCWRRVRATVSTISIDGENRATARWSRRNRRRYRQCGGHLAAGRI